MRRMKSRLVRVKVWYEPDASVEQAEAELRDVIAHGMARDKLGLQLLHSIEVGDYKVAPKQPEPDF